MFRSRALRFSAAIAAAVVMSTSLASSTLAAPVGPLGPADLDIQQINSGADKITTTDISIDRDYPSNFNYGGGNQKFYPFVLKNNGPHTAKVKLKATCGFANPNSGEASGVKEAEYEYTVINQQTRHIVIECSGGQGNPSGVNTTVRPVGMVDSNPQNNFAYFAR